jgi:(1->4)-alpha-D-glucan 1-alpha-D-glucosylmutase
VQAKGVEDRALFRFRRLMALNEVGGDPDRFGETVETFHERMRAASEAWPHRMLTTGTHDHKLGEDVRARLAALTEVPEAWERTVEASFGAFDRLQAAHPDAPSVHGADLYLLLQALVGAFPAGLAQGREGDDAFGDRLTAYLVKALREAAERTDWIDGDEAYEAAVTDLAWRALADEEVMSAVRRLLDILAPAGAVNGLAQFALKLGAPGVPDTYQGSELWDLTLVDPDNRRAVDFDLRRAQLTRIQTAVAGAREDRTLAPKFAAELVASWRDGAIKQYVLARSLAVRNLHPSLFLDGAYEPVRVVGARARNVVAYARRGGADAALVVAPRLSVELTNAATELWLPDWQDTRLELPSDLARATWRDAYTGAEIDAEATSLSVILGGFPVALLLREGW